MKKYLLILSMLCFPLTIVLGQVSISTLMDNPADSSAMLDVQSTDKGVLVPRMTTAQKNLISNPAIGLLVFDLTTESFWFYETSGWIELVSGNLSTLSDEDNDTKIQVEESPDEDLIRFDVSGTEFGFIDGQTFHITALGENVYVGENAGDGPGTGEQNTVIGTNAAESGLTGYDNVAIGYESMNSHEGGNDNTAVGRESLMFGSGSNNTAIGHSSIKFNSTGIFNTAVGHFAQVNNQDGNNNTSIGARSLRNNTSGVGNTAIGYFALQHQATGNYNTSIGHLSNVSSPSLTNATAIGAFSTVNQDSSIVLGNAADVGIGTTTPDEKLHVVGHIKMEDGNQSSGLVMTSDSVGTASWMPLIDPKLISDDDGDTKIQVEESPDEDVIRFDIQGTEQMTLDSILNVNTQSIFSGMQRDLLVIRNSANDNAAGLAFRNSGGLYTWSIFRDPFESNSTLAGLVFAGGGTNLDPNALSERMRIAKDGNIGIGTSVPDANLHIEGSFKLADGTEGVGKIMVSDSFGLTTWVDPNSGLIVPDTSLPVPIRYHASYLFVYPQDNAVDTSWASAQLICSDLSAFGFDDWYLPSLNELNAMYKQSFLITGLEETNSAKYWSNTEADTENAFTQRLDYGGPDPDLKTDVSGHHCRCVRKN